MSSDRVSIRQAVQDARQAMIATCESMRDSFSLSTLHLKKEAFTCGAACVDANPVSISDFNRCVTKCQEKVVKVDNISRTYLDATADRLDLCLNACYGGTAIDDWEKLPENEFKLKMDCSMKCYLTETEWIKRQKPRWAGRVEGVVSGKSYNLEISDSKPASVELGSAK